MSMRRATSLRGAEAPARLLIVDDHPLVRHGLAELVAAAPDLALCGETGAAGEVLPLVERLKPDLVVLDLSLKDGDGLELLRALSEAAPATPVLVSTVHDEALFAERALHAGARGYVNKSEAAETFIAAVRQVLAGKVHVSEALADRMLLQAAAPESGAGMDPASRLSKRELEVFGLIGQGCATRQISERLGLSIKTVETHRASIKRKLNLETATELTRRAAQWDLERGAQDPAP